ncbi:hypothetical protein D4764_0017660 [Takifugu flavidus]|uniref:Secreted protein n=1 Tax=Takifugu flavidus TaxID=433684 RepID=A0A5C6MK24_9TELE|nr:hypothetical protein D4764_0017660 [Takifugu flavidus]
MLLQCFLAALSLQWGNQTHCGGALFPSLIWRTSDTSCQSLLEKCAVRGTMRPDYSHPSSIQQCLKP